VNNDCAKYNPFNDLGRFYTAFAHFPLLGENRSCTAHKPPLPYHLPQPMRGSGRKTGQCFQLIIYTPTSTSVLHFTRFPIFRPRAEYFSQLQFSLVLYTVRLCQVKMCFVRVLKDSTIFPAIMRSLPASSSRIEIHLLLLFSQNSSSIQEFSSSSRLQNALDMTLETSS
jgi:hypothetical protein